MRQPGRIESRGRTSERNLFTEQVKVTSESNKGAVIDAINYCRASIDQLEKMKLKPEIDLQEIESIKAGIPKLDVFNEFSGERAIEGSKGINPRHLLKSDDQTAWELGKINEKFKKLMSPARKAA